MQSFTLWLQNISFLGQINLPTPSTITWVFAVANFAFSSITSGSLSTDCLLTAGPGHVNLAFKRLLLHLAAPAINLLILIAIQTLW